MRTAVGEGVLAQAIREMPTHAAHGGTSANAYLDGLFELAVYNLAHKRSTLGRATTRPALYALSPLRLRRALDLMEDRLDGSLSLGDLAQAAGLSRHHFSRVFQAPMGEPPIAYLARRRLEVAKQLLRASDMPLAEVARRSGHGSPSQFASSFRRRTGQTPSDYRGRL